MQFRRKCRHEPGSRLKNAWVFWQSTVRIGEDEKTPVLLGNPTPESHSEVPPLGLYRFLPLFGPLKGRNCGKIGRFWDWEKFPPSQNRRIWTKIRLAAYENLLVSSKGLASFGKYVENSVHNPETPGSRPVSRIPIPKSRQKTGFLPYRTHQNLEKSQKKH
jgi:hypothetical protein